MAFFQFTQNNSGGFTVGDYEYLLIEADTIQQANSFAILNGAYFDGVDKGMDCDCCGDRWKRVESYHSSYAFPLLYGREIKERELKRTKIVYKKK
jgi:hypothetical protein